MTSATGTKSRYAATAALSNSIEHIQQNFDVEIQRNAIMEAICNAAVSTQIEVRKAAFECFVHIEYNYYKYLEKYMEAIYKLTLGVFQNVENEDESVVIMAIEFWSTLCEIESDLESEESSKYISNIYRTLVPILFALAKYTEVDVPSENWDIKAAAAVCFSLIARLIQNDVLDVIFPLIIPCFQSSDWKARDAGLLFFGDLCESIDREDYVRTAIDSVPGFFQLINNDPCLLVKETSAWVLNKIFEFHTVSMPINLWPDIMGQLLNHLQLDIHVAYRSCTSLFNIAHAIGEEQGEVPEVNLLSQYFQVVVEKLLNVAQRTDRSMENLLIECYEAVNSWIEFVGSNCTNLMETIFNHIIQQITLKLNGPIDPQGVLLVGLMHGTLQVLYQRLQTPTVMDERVIGTVITNACGILTHAQFTSCYEDILLCLSSLISCVGTKAEQFLPNLHSIICNNLKQYSDSNVLGASIALVSDICSIEDSSFLLTYASDYANLLLSCLAVYLYYFLE